MKMNVEETKVMRIARQPSSLQIMTVQNNWGIMMQEVHVKLNPGLPWQKKESTRRYISPAKWT